MSTLDRFNTALITGSGTGLGAALAGSLVKAGKRVILAGRTREKLEAQRDALGDLVVGIYVIDFAKIDEIAAFARIVLDLHPDLDCVINNHGILKTIDFSKGPIEEYSEIDVNITSVLALCDHFIPHLVSQGGVLMNITSGLAYVPRADVPIYCATKAFVKSFTNSLRVQFRNSKLFVVEIAPPLVESDLYRGQESKSSVPAMAQSDFIAAIEDGWKSGAQEIGASFTVKFIHDWNETFGPVWRGMNKLNA